MNFNVPRAQSRSEQAALKVRETSLKQPPNIQYDNIQDPLEKMKLAARTLKTEGVSEEEKKRAIEALRSEGYYSYDLNLDQNLIQIEAGIELKEKQARHARLARREGLQEEEDRIQAEALAKYNPELIAHMQSQEELKSDEDKKRARIARETADAQAGVKKIVVPEPNAKPGGWLSKIGNIFRPRA